MSDDRHSLIRAMLPLAMLLLAGLFVAACDVEAELPCWAEVRADFRATDMLDPVTPTTLAEASGLVDARLETYGIAQRSVFTWGVDRIAVGFEEGAATEAVRRLIVAPGRLELVPIPAGLPGVSEGAPLPAGLPVLVEDEQLALARASLEDAGRPALELHFHSDGALALASWTEANLNGQLAIVLDGSVLALPTVMGPMRGAIMLTGPAFDQSSVVWLEAVLSHGPLRLALEEISFGPAVTVPCPPE